MNQVNSFLERQKVKRYLEKAYSYKENVIVFGLNEGHAHFLKKCEVCWKLKALGYTFICEARFMNNRGRADILVLENGGMAIEILNSEQLWSVDLKKQRYPVPVLGLPLSTEFVEEMLL